ncbi:MAG: transcription elongation factor GreB [Rhodospirillaceae bacterium]|jgi:transcription elongation factor GreB|nr:transcription elongation factor GreB [Rhodospirillaceae bacterium]MBT3627622.1 transcription elongation factor GreB [Rhodospirillaceae bacterium]MBT3925943.1 transcription elongation factor GreB [Rhodospirillaceae bacterium]MBT4427203.1 transcription elongation factor GreB [Rhodospirillaceae bacterium]MBT5039748.1 transcription elongation factor GreB [Rhodospirillaceae bacterium]
MNKAFTKETETEETLPEFVDALPPGTKNYMTPAGEARLQAELCDLRDIERAKLIAEKDQAPAKKRLREIDQRIQFINNRLQITEIVDQSRRKDCEQVFFGASVTYADSAGKKHSVRIVGVDEARLEKGEVSWVSPIARALNGAWLGDVVKLANPAGAEEVEILEIEYI